MAKADWLAHVKAHGAGCLGEQANPAAKCTVKPIATDPERMVVIIAIAIIIVFEYIVSYSGTVLLEFFSKLFPIAAQRKRSAIEHLCLRTYFATITESCTSTQGDKITISEYSKRVYYSLRSNYFYCVVVWFFIL